MAQNVSQANTVPDAYCVFGNPIAHSKSPAIHGLFAQQTVQNMQYEARLAPLDGFVSSVSEFVRQGGRGANVTVPFKLEAFELCDRLSQRAQSAGAVNTLRFENGRVEGDNTDGAGLVTDIVKNAGFAIKGKRVLLIGAGGAARGALLPLLHEEPQSLFIANRTVAKAEELVEMALQWKIAEVVCEAGSFGHIQGQFDLVINASSASLQGKSLVLSEGLFAKQSLAYDMMYGVELTPFLKFAQSGGAQVRDGLGMLIEQAAEAFFVWRGVRPETEIVFARLRQQMQG
ncbi:MAG: shikimate dehydrogenase [Burkholderiaceae bacterium]|nr:MAG: shikimate dehydrogenase [Burkholderiaceae bacterium]